MNDQPWWADLPRDRFGDSPALADELLALILSGDKTATCNALALAAQELIPYPGLRYVIEDGAGIPRCVIETIAVEQTRFDEVDADFAHDEGEGDRSLEYWRSAHEAYFRRNGVFTPDMTVLCERFRVVEIITPSASIRHSLSQTSDQTSTQT